MSDKKVIRVRRVRRSRARAMDVTMIATTVGCAAAANMLLPGLGSAVVGAILGAVIGAVATKPA